MTSYLIKNADVYAPEHLGINDVLVAEGRVAAVAPGLDVSFPGLETVDAEGEALVPGFIDQHVHVTGGGGEGGQQTCAPGLRIEEAADCGDTTVVGVLGADTVARSVVGLLAKIRALRNEGISTWMWTSNYAYPPVSLTESVRLDLYSIPECLGVKVAMADARSSFMTEEEMIRLVSEAWAGGRLAGKRGILHVHVGTLGGAFGMFMNAVRKGIPIDHFLPTHCARDFDAAVAFAKEGGRIDFTTDIPENAVSCVLKALEEGVPEKKISLTTDGHGALPVYDEAGRLAGLETLDIRNNLRAFKSLAGTLGLEKALPFVTSNVSDTLLIPKGRIRTGWDADFCFLGDGFEPVSVMANGRFIKRGGKVLAKGLYSAA